ncbi:hypothetical protein OSB04_020651 [Centaurea solstitialis]|uniref:Uncharacterized protein n=1 Tax=Centaurea solstitialis TaxID=347529 RepID=A0AA38TC98_9ASTR|nr:hypothetical protein OSB04_020651 [Centaurea solstitialis]
MDQDDHPPPTNRRQPPIATSPRRQPPSDPPILIFILLILFLILSIFFLLSPSSYPDIINPKPVNSIWNSFIIFLKILAIIAGLLADSKKVPSTPNATNPPLDLRRRSSSGSYTDSKQKQENEDDRLPSTNDSRVGKQNSTTVNNNLRPKEERKKKVYSRVEETIESVPESNNRPSESYLDRDRGRVQVNADFRRESSSSWYTDSRQKWENEDDRLPSSNIFKVRKQNSSTVNDNLRPKEERKENIYRSEPASDDVRHRPGQSEAGNVYSSVVENIIFVSNVPRSKVQHQSTHQVPAPTLPAPVDTPPAPPPPVAPPPKVAAESRRERASGTVGIDEIVQVTNQINLLLDTLLDGSHIPPPTPPAVAPGPPIDVESRRQRTSRIVGMNETEELTSQINRLHDDGSHVTPPLPPPVVVDSRRRRTSGNAPLDETEQVTSQINRLHGGSDIHLPPPVSHTVESKKRRTSRIVPLDENGSDTPSSLHPPPPPPARNRKHRCEIEEADDEMESPDDQRRRDRRNRHKLRNTPPPPPPPPLAMFLNTFKNDEKGKGKAPPAPPPLPPKNFFNNLFKPGGKTKQPASSSSSSAAAKPPRSTVQPLSPPLQRISDQLAAAMNPKSKGKTPPIPQPKSESQSQRTVKPPLPTKSSNYGDRDSFVSRDSSSSSSSSTLLPPPLPPFGIPAWIIERVGEYLVKVRSLHDSDFSTSDREYNRRWRFIWAQPKISS